MQCHAIELPAFMSPTEVGALKAQPGFVFLYKCHSVHICLCVNVNCIECDIVMETQELGSISAKVLSNQSVRACELGSFLLLGESGTCEVTNG